MERFVCGQRAGQVIVWNIELGRFAVDEQTCAGGFLGSIVGECYVMPLVGRDGLMGADFDRVAGPLIDQMDFDLAVDQQHVVASEVHRFVHARQDCHASERRYTDP